MSCQCFGHVKFVNIAKTHLVEGMGLDLREFVLHVVRVHGADLVARGRAEHFDDFHELVDTRLAGEERLSEHEFGHDTASGPHICFMSANCSLTPSHPHNIPIFVV